MAGSGDPARPELAGGLALRRLRIGAASTRPRATPHRLATRAPRESRGATRTARRRWRRGMISAGCVGVEEHRWAGGGSGSGDLMPGCRLSGARTRRVVGLRPPGGVRRYRCGSTPTPARTLKPIALTPGVADSVLWPRKHSAATIGTQGSRDKSGRPNPYSLVGKLHRAGPACRFVPPAGREAADTGDGGPRRARGGNCRRS